MCSESYNPSPFSKGKPTAEAKLNCCRQKYLLPLEEAPVLTNVLVDVDIFQTAIDMKFKYR